MFQKKLIPVIFLLSSTNIFAQGFSRPTIDLSMSAFSVKESALLSRGASSVFESQFNYAIDEDFKLNFWPVISFISGQQTSRDPQSPLTNSFYMKEATAEKDFSSLVKFKAGAIYQKEFVPGMVGYYKSFPGVGVTIPLAYSVHDLKLKSQASVPTSSGLATTTTELESNSTLYSAGFVLNSAWTQNFKTEFSYTHYKYNNLSTQAGFDSLQRGNTVVKLNSSTGYFVYKYGGDEFVLSLDSLMFDVVNLKMKGSFTRNTLAPSNLNTGYYFTFAPGVRISPKYIFRPQFDYYHVQADAMVAVFSDTTFGRTNREGFRAGFNIESENYNVKLIYAKSKLVASNPFQSNDTSTFLNLDIKNIHL